MYGCVSESEILCSRQASSLRQFCSVALKADPTQASTHLPIPVHAALAVVTVDVAFPPMFCLSLVLLVLAGCGFLQCLSNTLWMGIKIYRKLLIV